MKELVKFALYVLVMLVIDLGLTRVVDMQKDIQKTQESIQIALNEATADIQEIKTEMIVTNGICNKVLNNEW